MDTTITRYLTTIVEPATRRAVRADLASFAGWWADQRGQAFDPTQLLAKDVAAWVCHRQADQEQPHPPVAAAELAR